MRGDSRTAVHADTRERRLAPVNPVQLDWHGIDERRRECALLRDAEQSAPTPQPSAASRVAEKARGRARLCLGEAPEHAPGDDAQYITKKSIYKLFL